MMKPFCVLPFVQFSTTVSGDYQACCIAKQQKENIIDISPLEFFNSEHMKQLRYDMLKKGMSPLIQDTCYKCLINEQNTGNSKRLQNLYTTRDDKVDVLKQSTLKKISENKDVDLTPTDMDSFKIKIFGNLCNLKCTMCNPNASSKIAAEFKKYGEWNKPAIINPSKHMNMNKFLDDLKIVLPTTNQIEIVGGEPFLYPETFDLVNWIVENDLAKNLEIRFVTNGMTENFDLFSLFKYFKQVTVMFSVDGFGKKDEYIRTGTNWEEKVMLMKNVAQIPKVKMSFSTTTQLLNIGYLDEIHDFIKKTFGITPRLNNGLSFPNWARAVNVPKDIANKYLKRYENKQFNNKPYHIKTLLNDKERKHHLFEYAIKRYKQFDERRNTNLLDVYPEFEAYY